MRLPLVSRTLGGFVGSLLLVAFIGPALYIWGVYYYGGPAFMFWVVMCLRTLSVIGQLHLQFSLMRVTLWTEIEARPSPFLH